MTTTVAVQSGLGTLAAAVQEAVKAWGATGAACDRAQREHDEARTAAKELEAARGRAVAQAVTVLQLRGIDRRLEDARRRVEVATSALERVTIERERAKTAQREAERRLAAGRKRAAQLPQSVLDLVRHATVREREAEDAARVVASIRADVARTRALASRLAAEYAQLTGSPLRIEIDGEPADLGG
jgi:chromosome segregation ATPase